MAILLPEEESNVEEILLVTDVLLPVSPHKTILFCQFALDTFIEVSLVSFGTSIPLSLSCVMTTFIAFACTVAMEG